MKILLASVLISLIIFPAFAQEESEKVLSLTDKGTLKVGFSTIPANPKSSEPTKLKIEFINKDTNSIQNHIDYSLTVTKQDTQVFGVPITHTAEGEGTIQYQFQESGKYQISVDVLGILFQPIPKETASFSIVVGESSQPKNGCLIATAAFGSDLAPQIQFLREYRDETIMSTLIGSSFIKAFNTVYYSFSPTVADAERANPILQEFVKAGITPLLGILEISKLSLIGNDSTSILISGSIASTLIGAVYLGPLALSSRTIRETSRSKTLIVLVIVISLLTLTLISNFLKDEQLAMVSTAGYVLSVITFGGLFSTRTIWKVIQKFKITFL